MTDRRSDRRVPYPIQQRTRLADVCHQTEIQCLARPLFLVGCQFVRPIASGTDSPASTAVN